MNDRVAKLHGYWRSTASYRVRIALNLKAVSVEQRTYDLRTGAQRSAAYLALAPIGLVPALDTGEQVLTQSPAILEWLEERFPDPPLLPRDPGDRAIVRAMGALIACDIHPLNNLRVLQVLRADFAATPDQIQAWIARWIHDGFTGLEPMVGRHGAGFAFGHAPSLADCYLVPQLFAAERFGVKLDQFPNILKVAHHVRALPAFAEAHPSRQPDADPA